MLVVDVTRRSSRIASTSSLYCGRVNALRGLSLARTLIDGGGLKIPWYGVKYSILKTRHI